MSDNVDTARRWLDVLERGALDEWDNVVAEDLTLHAVAMPGDNAPVIGRDANRARVAQVWQAWKKFAFHDVDVHAAADDPNLVFAIARGQAETVWGATYANHYAFRLRFHAGLIQEHLEFFDPAAVMGVFKDRLGQ
jgi:ketosteroid isomerase-like protein